MTLSKYHRYSLEKSKKAIADISDDAIEQANINQTRGIKSKVLINAGKYLDGEKLAYLRAEIFFEEENFNKAALLYHKANRTENFEDCVRRINDKQKLNLAFHTLEDKLARDAIIGILGTKKHRVIDLVLGTEKGVKICKTILASFEETDFKNSVENYYKNNPDFVYSKSIANTIKNEKDKRKRIEEITTKELNQLLSVHENDNSLELEEKIASLLDNLENPISKIKIIKDTEWKHLKENDLLLKYHKKNSNVKEFVLHLMDLINDQKNNQTVISRTSVEIAEKIRQSGKKSKTNIANVVKELQNKDSFTKKIPPEKRCIEVLLANQESQVICEIYKTAILIKILGNKDIGGLKKLMDDAQSEQNISQDLSNFFTLATNLIIGININKNKFRSATVYKNVLKLLSRVVNQGSLDTMMLYSLIPQRWNDSDEKSEMNKDIKTYTKNIKLNEDNQKDRNKKTLYAETFFSIENNEPFDYQKLPQSFRTSEFVFALSILEKMDHKGEIKWIDFHTIPLINLSKIYSKISQTDKWILKKLREKKFSILMELYDKSVIPNNREFKQNFAYLKCEEFESRDFLIDYEETENIKPDLEDNEITNTDEKIITQLALDEIGEIQGELLSEVGEENSSITSEIEEPIASNVDEINELPQSDEEMDTEVDDLDEILDLSVEVSTIQDEVLISEDMYITLSEEEEWKKLFNPIIKRFLDEIIHKSDSSIEKAQTVRTLVKDIAMIEPSEKFPNHFKALLSIRLFDYRGFQDSDGNIEKTFGKELHRNMLKEMFDAGKSDLRSIDRSEYPIYAQIILISNVDFYAN